MSVPVEQVLDAATLVELDRRAHLEDLAAPVHDEAVLLGPLGELAYGLLGGGLVGGAAPVIGADHVLVLGAHAQPVQLLVPGLARPRVHARRPARHLGIELDLGPAAAQHLGAVVADVGDRAQRDDPPRGRGAAPRHARDQPVALGHGDERHARRLGHVRVVGVAHDRRQHPVDVEQDRAVRADRRCRGARSSSNVAAVATDLVCRRLRRADRWAIATPRRRRSTRAGDAAARRRCGARPGSRCRRA